MTTKTDKKSTTSSKGVDKKPRKRSSALVAASKARSAVNHVLPDSSMDVRGSSGLANTGPVTSYENED